MMFQWDERALDVLRRLREKGHQAVLVGGCVRDGLLGVPLHDYDAATDARPEEIMAACAPLPCLEVGAKHGTITVLSGGLPVEVTTFRREGVYTDHRRPDGVEFTHRLEADLARRDLTVNAMAWSPAGLVDLYGGQADLKAGVIRCVGDPERRFREDALRILRAVRLAAQLDFTLHPDTAAAVKKLAPDLDYVARERVWGEFSRLLCAPGAQRILLDFPEVVTRIIPELAPCVDFDQKNPHHRYDVYEHTMRAVGAAPPLLPVRLGALLHDIGKPPTFSVDDTGTGHFYGHAAAGLPLAEGAMIRLRLPAALREEVLTLVARHNLPVLPDRKWVGRWLARLGEEPFFHLLALKGADRAACADPAPPSPDPLALAEEQARALLAENACLALKDLAVNGRDALALGLKGRAVGEVLKALLARVAEGDLPNEQEILLAELKKMSSSD